MDKVEKTILKMEKDIAHYKTIKYFPAKPASMEEITKSMLSAYKQGVKDAKEQ